MKKWITTLFSLSVFTLLGRTAFAEDGATGGGASSGMIALAAGLCMGLGAFGGALSQAKTASAALEGIARNPQAAAKVQTPMIIALAMTESLVLFAFGIAFFLKDKV
jgi:F-type H+-transporting ATPase subunit c